MSSPSRPDEGYETAKNNNGFVTAEEGSPSPPKQLSKAQKKRQRQRASAAASAPAASAPAASAPAAAAASEAINFSGYKTVLSKKEQAAARKLQQNQEAAAAAEAAEAEAEVERQHRREAAEVERKRKADEEAAERQRRREAAEVERKRKADEEAAERKRKAAEEAAERKRKSDEAEAKRKADEAAREEQRRKEAEEERREKEAFEARLEAAAQAKRQENIQSARYSRRAASHARKASKSQSSKSRKSPGFIRGNISKQFPHLHKRNFAAAMQPLKSLSPREHVAAPPLMQTEEAQIFTLMVATELFAMYNSTQLNNLMIEKVKSATIRDKLRNPKKRHEVFLFFLKGGAATTIIREHEYLMNADPEAPGAAMSLFRFTSDLDFSLLVNPALPLEDFQTIRAILFAATVDLIYNIASTYREDVPHILPAKRLKEMNKIFGYFYEPLKYEILGRGAQIPAHGDFTVKVTPVAGSRDDAALITPEFSLYRYIAAPYRPLDSSTYLNVNIMLNRDLKLSGSVPEEDIYRLLYLSTITLQTRSRRSFILLDIAFPTSENPKANFEWDLASNDMRIIDTHFMYMGNKVRVVFPLVGPVANFVDQAYAALPFTETRPHKVAARQGRAQKIARNILVPHARNFAKTIRAISKIRYNNGSGTRRRAGNLLRNAMGNAYPNSTN